MIIKNSIKCKHCKDIITSKNRHDFNMCSCNKVGVDGGLDYLRRIGDLKDYEDLSIEGNSHEEFRQHLTWGKNYDENMNRLPETQWITIENMSTDHIEAIIDGGFSTYNPFYDELFLTELIYRRSCKR